MILQGDDSFLFPLAPGVRAHLSSQNRISVLELKRCILRARERVIQWSWRFPPAFRSQMESVKSTVGKLDKETENLIVRQPEYVDIHYFTQIYMSVKWGKHISVNDPKDKDNSKSDSS